MQQKKQKKKKKRKRRKTFTLMFMSFCMCKFNLSRYLYVGRSYKPDFIAFEKVGFSYPAELSRCILKIFWGTLDLGHRFMPL